MSELKKSKFVVNKIKTSFKLIPELKTKWLNDLRSGKYKQGSETLRHKDYFCCLGVFADGMNGMMWVEEPSGHYKYFVNGFHYSSGLPTTILPIEVQSELMFMNDELNYSFDQIADVIESSI